MKQFILILRGPSGAGKTSTSKLIQEKVGEKVAHLRADYFYWKVCPQNENKNIDNNSLVYKNLSSLTENYIKEGYSVIVEGLLNKIDSFKLHESLVEMAKENNVTYQRIYLGISLDVAIQRNSIEKGFVPKADMERYIQEGKDSIKPEDIVLQTSNKSPAKIVNEILNKLSS